MAHKYTRIGTDVDAGAKPKPYTGHTPRHAPRTDRESLQEKRAAHGQKLRRVSRAALIVLIGMVFSFFVLFLTHWGWPAPPHVPALSLEELRNGTYAERIAPVSWVPNGADGQVLLRRPTGFTLEHWGRHDSREVANLTLRDGDNDVFIERLELNAAQTHALAFVDARKNWRHSSFHTVYLLDLAQQQQRPQRLVARNASIAAWSPDGARIAFVRDRNLFLAEISSSSSSAEAEELPATQITRDGGDSVFNGIPDWVYEEEVLQGDSALWWSASGHTLAYLRTNDSAVPQFPIPYFLQKAPSSSSINESSESPAAYPQVLNLKYPKPGFANPRVSLWLHTAGAEHPRELAIDTALEDPIISEVLFVGETVVAKLMNREADVLEVWTAETDLGSSSSSSSSSGAGEKTRAALARRQDSDGAWFEVTHNAHAVGTEGYIDTVDHNGFNHLALFSPANASTPRILTEGDWEVADSQIAVNLATRHVYFTGSLLSSRQNTVLRAPLDGGRNGGPVAEPELVAFAGNGTYSVDFSGDASFATVTFRAPEAPAVQKIVRLQSKPSTSSSKSPTTEDPVEREWVLEENAALLALLRARGVACGNDSSCAAADPLVRYGEVTLGNNVTVNFREIRPTRFNPRRRHPVLFYNYGGPGSQLVQERLVLDFQRVYAEQHNAVVVTIDPRGTGNRGRRFRGQVRDHLGEFEADDVIEAAKLWNAKPYVDGARTALWGWSYGGFLTLKVLERDADLAFRVGVAVAPVTDWALYDSVYTERYMHRPSNNADGYARSSIRNVSSIARHERFLVMHGSGDDNVHFQNTLDLVDRLDLAGVENYDMHVYPDSDHAIAFHNANHMVYDRVDSWLQQHTQRQSRL